jgi:hypothetical protein
MNFRGAFLLVLLMLLAACAQQVDLPAVKATYAAAKPTVAKLADADFAPLAFPSKTEFDIDAASPAFDFGAEGVSYFRAFELPPSDRPYTVVVASAARDYDCLPCRRAYFYQKVMVLDAAKKPLAGKLVRGPVYKKSSLLADRLDRREVWLNLTPDMGARYIVIYTTRALIAQGDDHTERVGDGVVTNGNVALIFEGKPETLHMAGMPVGSLSVEVKETGR